MFFKDALKAEVLSAIKTKLIQNSKGTLRSFIDTLPKHEQDVFLEYKIEELFDLSSLQKESKEETKKIATVPVVDKDEYSAKVLQFLKEGGLGESGRGYSTGEISKACGGDVDSTRSSLTFLLKDRKVADTGKTQSKRWVSVENKKAAEANFAKERS